MGDKYNERMSRGGAADLRGFEKVEGVLPEADLAQTAAGRGSKVGQVFAEPITPERMGVLKSALAQVNAPPPPKPPPIDRMMAAIAEGVRNPTYQNPQPVAGGSAPKPATFADIERAMGVAPSGQSAGAFNPVDMDQRLGRYLSSEYSGGGAREAAGIRGQSPMARSGVVQGAVQDFTTANPNLRSAFNNFRPDMGEGWQAAASDEALAQHLFGNPQGYLGGGPRQGALTVVPQQNFTMNGPSSEWAPRNNPVTRWQPPVSPAQEYAQASKMAAASRNPLGRPMVNGQPAPQIESPSTFAERSLRNLSLGDDPLKMVAASRNVMPSADGRMIEGFGQLGPEMPVMRDYSHLGVGGGGSGPTISELQDEYVRGTIRPPRGPDSVASGMSSAGAEARAAGSAARAAPTVMDDLRTVGAGLRNAAGTVGNVVGGAVGGVQEVLGRTAGGRLAMAGGGALLRHAPVLAALYEAGNKDAEQDPFQRALGVDTLNASMRHMLDAEKQGDYGTVAADMAKLVPKAAYTGVVKPFVEAGNMLGSIGASAPPKQLTADETRAKIAETAKGASLIDDNDMSDPIKNAARYEQIKAQREQRLQNEPYMTVRMRQPEGPMPDGSEAPARDMRMLADEVRNSPMRDEIMRRGVMSTPQSPDVVIGARGVNGGAGGRDGGGPSDFGTQLRDFIAYAEKNHVPIATRDQGIAALAHAYGTDATRPYYDAMGLHNLVASQPKPLKESEKAQADANSLRERSILARAVMRNPAATADQKSYAQAALDEIDARMKFDRNIYHSGDPNDLDVGAIIEIMRRGQGMP